MTCKSRHAAASSGQAGSWPAGAGAGHAGRRPAGSGVSAVTAASVLGLSLAACGGTTTTATAPGIACATTSAAPFTLVVGARANTPVPALPPAVTVLTSDAVGAHKQVTLIRLDGSPKVVFSQSFTIDAGNSGARKSEVNGDLGVIQREFNGPMHAQAPQADVLTALTLAARATPPGGNLVLADSGLQTVSPLDFRHDNLLQAEPAEVTTFLKKQQLLPDLTGQHVVLVGLGNTAAPQAQLNNRLHKGVIAIWRQIALAGGATCVGVSDAPDTQPSLTGVPAVGVVSLPAPVSFKACGETDLGNGGSVGFLPNQAVFRDPAAARSTLHGLAGMLRDGQQKVELIGRRRPTSRPRAASYCPQRPGRPAHHDAAGVAASRFTPRASARTGSATSPTSAPTVRCCPGRPKRTGRSSCSSPAR